MQKTFDNNGLAPRSADGPARRLQRPHPADDGGELFRPGRIRLHPPGVRRHGMVSRNAAQRPAAGRLGPAIRVLRHRAADRDAARRGDRAGHAKKERLGDVAHPGADRAAIADTLERDRHHLGDLPSPRHRPAWAFHRPHARHSLRLSDSADRGLDVGDADGGLALDAAGGAARLCRAARDSRRLLSGGAHRRRVRLGGVPLHPAAENARRADDRDPAALRGQLPDLYRAVRADRRRTRATRRPSCPSTSSRSRSASSTSDARAPSRSSIS